MSPFYFSLTYFIFSKLIRAWPLFSFSLFVYPLDTAWDVGNLIYDAWNGNWGDVAADAVAMCIPGLPDGMTKLYGLKEQALALKKLNNDKNTVTIQTPDKKIHYDLDGNTHKGVETPHKQYSYPNTNPKTGGIFWNKDRKAVDSMNQQDTRTVRRYLERKNR
jgi:hypothetical protein